MSLPIRFSAGLNTFDNTPTQVEVSDFAGLVEHMETRRGARKGRNFICASMSYGPHDDTAKHQGDAHYRLASHAEGTSVLTMDVDGLASPKVFDALRVIAARNQSYVYETASSTPEAPRARVLFNLDREVYRDERIALGLAVQAGIEAEIAAKFGAGAIKFDPAVYRPEQPNYNPTIGAKSYKFLGGPPLRVDDIISRTGGRPELGDGKRQNKPTGGAAITDLLGPVPRHILAARTGHPVRNPFAAAMAVLLTPMMSALIWSALSAIPSDNREIWIKVLHALKTLDVDGGVEGRRFGRQWSMGSSKFDEANFDSTWESLNTTNTSHEQIFRTAENYGWDVNAETARISSDLVQQDATSQDVQSVLSEARTLNLTTYGSDLMTSVASLPVRSWVYPQLLLRGYIGLIVGPGGVAKSTLQLVAAVGAATGRDLLGLGRVRQCNVLVINNEDDETELKRRIAAILIHYGVDPAELDGKLFTISGYMKSIRFANYAGNIVSRSQTLNQIEALIGEHEIGALFVDPFISTHTAPENDNNAMDQVVSIFKQLAGKRDIAISIAHHTKKVGGGGDTESHAGDAESGRGASAIKDAARAAVTVARMSEKTAKKLAIPDEERGGYIRMDVGKSNFAAHDSKANWFRIESVKLPNGDTVGVPKPVNLDALFAQVAEGRRAWTAERVAAAVSSLFPTDANQVPWADVKSRFAAEHGVGNSVAASNVALLPQEGEPPIRAGNYVIWISRTAPRNGWMLRRKGVSDV